MSMMALKASSDVFKGNIRVYCRVRPMLASDVPSTPLNRSDEYFPNEMAVDEEVLLQTARADMSFPDKMDHQQIVLRASSESATGQERRDEWTFAFDRVRSHSSCIHKDWAQPVFEGL